MRFSKEVTRILIGTKQKFPFAVLAVNYQWYSAQSRELVEQYTEFQLQILNVNPTLSRDFFLEVTIVTLEV